MSGCPPAMQGSAAPVRVSLPPIPPSLVQGNCCLHPPRPAEGPEGHPWVMYLVVSPGQTGSQGPEGAPGEQTRERLDGHADHGKASHQPSARFQTLPPSGIISDCRPTPAWPILAPLRGSEAKDQPWLRSAGSRTPRTLGRQVPGRWRVPTPTRRAAVLIRLGAGEPRGERLGQAGLFY